MKRIFLLMILLTATMMVSAETDRQFVRDGNRQFRQQKFADAETAYAKALDQNRHNPMAMYNLGCALLAQQKDSAALVQFENAAKIETDKMNKSKIFHNIGWIHQSKKQFGPAIDAYKESLRNNPKDDETRYNLALCQYQKKKEDARKQQQQQQQQKQEQEDQDKSQQDQQQKSPASEDEQKKDDMKNYMNYLDRKDQEIQDKMNKMKMQPQDRSLEKNW